MQQNWHIRSRAHACTLTERPFEDKEVFHTAIYFDPDSNDYARRDICAEAWRQELEQRTPIASWKTIYEKVLPDQKPEIAPKESAQELLQRFIEDGDPKTEDARYILALMLERKRQLVQTAEKEVDGNKMLFYENKKTGEIFIVRDPELKLNELMQMQEEVASILAFGGAVTPATKAPEPAPVAEDVKPDDLDPTASVEAESDANSQAAAEEETTAPVPPTPEDH